MTLAGAFLPRRFPALPQHESRIVKVARDALVRLDCHWQADRAAAPAVVLVHGLEGSSESHYMLGTAEKAWRAGFSAVRMNVRNCGGTERLCATLYHSGLSSDVGAVAEWLAREEGVRKIHLAGFSMGGNQVLKLAGEWGADAPREVASFATVCPSLELGRCADAIDLPENRLYQWNFMRGLKARLRRKARLFPHLFRTDTLRGVRTMRQFDDAVTGPYCGFGNADRYYRTASALQFVARIARPTLIVMAQDDPFIPFESFNDPALRGNPNLTLLAPAQGGHCGFIGRRVAGEDRYWAENRVVQFIRQHSSHAFLTTEGA